MGQNGHTVHYSSAKYIKANKYLHTQPGGESSINFNKIMEKMFELGGSVTFKENN